ncbi:MAG: acyl-CoA dehydrogenase family protein [Haloarculaceae archaeon]
MSADPTPDPSDDAIDYGRFDRGRGDALNYWTLDPTLRFEARRAYPEGEYEWARDRLEAFGDAVAGPIAENAEEIDRQGMDLDTYDRDGEVINEVRYPAELAETERLTYEAFGLTHDAFHAPPGREEPVSLVHPLTMQALLSYNDAGFVCPASMTVGAALVLETFDDGANDGTFRRLTSRDYDEHVEGAMFLTEKQGGSDVGSNEVRAEPQDDDTHELYGEKWFCSNVDAEGALALARMPGAPGGTEGLSLFVVPHTDEDGDPNDLVVRRLKDKLGTLAVPTGEIVFEGADATLVGEAERGFRYMTEMLNYERLTNATGAVGIMGRALLEAKIHAANREAFGETIGEFPLMKRDLVEMTVDYEAAAAFSFEAAKHYAERQRQGGGDGARDSDAYRLMRLLVPVGKYKTARMAVETASYAMEVLGGNGYVRGFTVERLYRDAQVLPIWEGTSNVLSLDVLRVLGKEAAHEALIPYVEDLLDVEHPFVEEVAADVKGRFVGLQEALMTLATEDEDYAQYHAKRLADLLFDVVTAAVLVSEAQWAIDEDGDGRKALVAESFVRSRFGEDEAYGVTSGDRSGMERFDAVARYASVDPETLVEAPAADD